MSAVVVLSLLVESLFHKTVHAAVCHLGSMSAAGGCSSRAAGSFRGCCPNSEGGLAACTGGATAHELRVAGRSCSCIRCVPALTALSNHTIDCADHAISSGNVEWHVCMHACLCVQHALTARQTLLSRLCRPLYKADPGVPTKQLLKIPPHCSGCRTTSRTTLACPHCSPHSNAPRPKAQLLTGAALPHCRLRRSMRRTRTGAPRLCSSTSMRLWLSWRPAEQSRKPCH